jgi:hypothetical protein
MGWGARRECRGEEWGVADLVGLDQAQLLWIVAGLVVGFFVFGVRKKG